MIGQSLVEVNAASENAQNRNGQFVGMQGRTKVNASRWWQAIQRRCRQEEGKDRKETQKESGMVRCILLNGSAWTTEKREEVHEKVQGIFDIFFGVEHKMSKEEMEEQFTKEAKQGWRFAADTAIITDENASSEDRKNTSVGVFVVVNSNLGAGIGKEEEQLRQSQTTRDELPKQE